MSTPGTNAVAAIQYPDSEKLRLAEESRTYVSKVGTHVAEHILILDAAPSWEDRESGGSPAKAETAVVPAAVPEAAPVVAPVVVEEVAVQEEEVVEAVGAEVAGAGAAERMVDAVTAAPVASGTWQLNESTLDSLVLVCERVFMGNRDSEIKKNCCSFCGTMSWRGRISSQLF